MTAGREQDYFVDGATESLTTNLSRISDVRMIRIAITAEAFTAPRCKKVRLEKRILARLATSSRS